MTTTLDELMDRDPLSMSDKDIDDIIAHHRRNRAIVESGGKVKKEEGPKIDLKELGIIKDKPVYRRF